MTEKTRRRICIVAFSMLCAMALACACSKQKTTDNPAEPETTLSEATNEPVREKPLPHRNKPTATPTPTPASVYIPGEILPEGQILEEGYFAVLPGEGAYYNVFDCYGKQVGSFSFTDSESRAPTGVYTEQSLSRHYRFNGNDVQSILPEDQDYTWIYSNENGFYQRDYEKRNVILYNKAGKHIQTLSKEPSDANLEDEYEWVDIVVVSYENETVVSFSADDWEKGSYSVTIYFVAPDGTINDKCVAKDLPGKPIGLLGRKYFIVSGVLDTDDCDVYDFDGKLIMEKVSLIEEHSLTLWSSEAVTYIKVSDYCIKDGITYDSSFHAISKNEVDPDGNLIYGAEYDVEGITCTAKYSRQDLYYFSSDPADRVAVGTKDGRIAIKTRDSEYVFDYIGDYCSMNDYVLVLTDKNYNMHVISLETGEVLYVIDHEMAVFVAEEYVLVSFFTPVTDSEYIPGTYFIDKDGNVRYVSQNAYAECTLGEYIVLYRGPYVGIADLNGDWIIKALTWELTRDEDYIYRWEE